MRKKTEIKCNGMMLTAGFHAANPPLIWRFDLERNHSFTLALQGEEGDWEIGLTSPKGEFHSVVHFLAREDAEEAFAKIEEVLSHKRGVMRYVGQALLIVAILAVIVVVGVGLFVRHVSQVATAGSSPYAMPMSSALIQEAPFVRRDGVPEPADQILQPPPQ